jgi:hypothetical protein
MPHRIRTDGHQSTKSTKSTKSVSGKGKGATKYAKTSRKDTDGRVVYMRGGSSADFVRRKDATGAMVYRKITAPRSACKRGGAGVSSIRDLIDKIKVADDGRESRDELYRKVYTLSE